MLADLFDSLIIKMAGVTQKTAGDIVRMLKSFKDGVREGKLSALSKLCPGVLVLEMDILHPAVVSCSDIVGHMFLEDNYVGIWKLFCTGGGEDWSGTVVDGVDENG